MNRVVFVLTLTLATNAVAAPIAYYNPTSGNIRFGNDTGGTLAGMYLQSLSGDKVINDPNRFSQIPGATFNSGDLPFGFTYFGFPPTGPVNAFPTSIDIGNVIVPGTSASDLSMGAFNALMVEFIGTVVEVPEPATRAIVYGALVGFAVTSRGRASAPTRSTSQRLSRRSN